MTVKIVNHFRSRHSTLTDYFIVDEADEKFSNPAFRLSISKVIKSSHVKYDAST